LRRNGGHPGGGPGEEGELTPAEVDAIARRVVEMLRSERLVAPETPNLVSAAEAAARIGRSRDFVYDHATDLGAIRLGDGPRPRLAFDPRTLDEWAARDSRVASKPARTSSASRSALPSRRRDTANGLDLLPIARSNTGVTRTKRPGGARTPPARHQEVES
jgi:hypothetical protein